ncbi:MAG: dephospho-CoA kinase [Candidatus Woesearchaeota archaeon]|jgi:dephospho-CoA kinase|nr:dephospho-CoA kinase [archaeon]MDP6547775.1 dephospho-CoA kinase [Candidatus Woesearchaeota archaeon]MDP7263726.1 dephospho-CoA kinase [Candidatus Woesearchaeota archaeon]MDP7622783.1 dephospho-CoA kinase [Candidatus Woesearchaeota archaeon]HJN56484.1 dephospho-CoA kinase [Candidatus Woesearchaeota archaeon]|tara:strand:+ start:18663 stop:19289 length:627 start_codon:yes stop_codon:yes gene_type:complete
MILGITGSFGSGKSTVADIFKRYGFKVINADKLYSKLSSPNSSIYNKIKKEFGDVVIKKNRFIDREKLKKIIFSDSKRLKKLNSITHPVIIKEIKKEISQIKKSNKKTSIIKENNNIKIIIDAPLLIEANATGLVDKIVVVKCEKKEQIKRILKKRKYTKIEIDNIVKSQMPLREKLKYADFVVDNSKSMKEAEKQIVNILKTITFNI